MRVRGIADKNRTFAIEGDQKSKTDLGSPFFSAKIGEPDTSGRTAAQSPAFTTARWPGQPFEAEMAEMSSSLRTNKNEIG